MDIKTSILDLLGKTPEASSADILRDISSQKSIATVKRALASLLSEGLISSSGKGRSTNFFTKPLRNGLLNTF